MIVTAAPCEDSTTRLVRGSADLADLIHRAILEAAGTLVRTGQLLWDVHREDRREIWRPKSEAAFGAWLAEQLRASLVRGGVVISARCASGRRPPSTAWRSTSRPTPR